MSGKYTESQAKAIKNYLSKMAEIRIRLKPEEKTIIEEKAKKAGKSVNRYIIDLALMEK